MTMLSYIVSHLHLYVILHGHFVFWDRDLVGRYQFCLFFSVTVEIRKFNAVVCLQQVCQGS